jgi:hypothetical protein
MRLGGAQLPGVTVEKGLTDPETGRREENVPERTPGLANFLAKRRVLGDDPPR